MLLTLLLLALPALAAGGSACLPSPGDGSSLCLSWSATAGNLTLNVQCVAPTQPPSAAGPVAWCAVGFAIPPNANLMFPSNVMVFGQLPSGGCGVGDYNTASYAQPACLPEQFSTALACTPGAGNAMNFTITRPLAAPAPAVTIVPGSAYGVIGSISTTKGSPGSCPDNSHFSIHQSAFSGGPGIVFL